MLILEFREVIHIFVDDNVEVIWLVMRRDVCLCKCFRHLELLYPNLLYKKEKREANYSRSRRKKRQERCCEFGV